MTAKSLKVSLSSLEIRKNYLLNLPSFNYSLTNLCYLQDYSRPKWVVNAIVRITPPIPLGKGGVNRSLFVIHLGLLYKIIEFNQIEKVNLVNVKAVETMSKFTLFPIVNDMNEEILSDFLIDSGYKNYEFLLDIQPELKFIESQAKIINSKIEILLSQYILLSKQVDDLVERWMTNKIYDIENKLNESVCELNIAKQTIEEEESKFEKLELESQEKLKQDLADLEANSRNESILIKQKYKGLYSYRWKSERKTWRYAKKTIYFDFGDEVLFERIDSKLFRKILKQDFINKYRL